MAAPHLFIGIMSGTSLDGADAILCDFSHTQPRTLAFQSTPYPDALHNEILDLCSPAKNELERAGAVSVEISTIYADLVRRLIAQAKIETRDVAAIGSHGQTVRHRPEAGFTLQLQNPALLAELTGISVVADFRSRDLAAGGQGAPLVPAFHAGIFSNEKHDRAVVNIGGISNITVLNRSFVDIGGVGHMSVVNTNHHVIGFDCGPGNVLMDSWIAEHRNRRFDPDGAWAASGRVLPDLLNSLLAEPYFQLAPPKSTGRELFNTTWLKANIHAVFEPADIQATLLEFTATVIANDVKKYVPHCAEAIICGGGAYNKALMARLAALLPSTQVLPSDDLGVPAQHVEAMAFAWLAKQALEGKAIDLTSITGARHANILGAIYRY